MISKGFSLLEVLIALLLVSVALGALVQQGALRADTLSELEKKNMAYLVANSEMDILYRTSVEQGTYQGVKNGFHRKWYWQATVNATDNVRILRIDLKVSLSPDFDYSYAQLTGFSWQ